MSDPDRPGPLSGLLVADFSRVLAGPYCTMLLATAGAISADWAACHAVPQVTLAAE